MKTALVTTALMLAWNIAAFGEVRVCCDYPGGSIVVKEIDETNGVVKVATDLRDTKGRKWMRFDFKVRGAEGRTLHFQFPDDKFDYLATLGPAVSRDEGRTWAWLHQDGSRHEPSNAFDWTFAPDEHETRFAFCIPYLQSDWEKLAAKYKSRKDVVFDVLCKSQSGERDTELLRLPCIGSAKWLFVFTARHHASEASASFVMEGAIEESLSGSKEAAWLRDNADCVFVPFMDKDGVEKGEQGKFRHPHDHNRDYMKDRYTSVRALKELLAQEGEGKKIIFIDLHSPSPRSGLTGNKIHDHAFTFAPLEPMQRERWRHFRRAWVDMQKNGMLKYGGKFDKAGSEKEYAEAVKKQSLNSRQYVGALSNCWMSVCCEFGYSLCDGVYTPQGARELGANMLKAAVQTACGSAGRSDAANAIPRADEANAGGSGVKWRGVFVNDEDWSLRPWAVGRFGKEEQIGTNAYSEIFSLMKRCGLNLIWPAMHEGGYEFSSRQENFELADRYGITVGTSHCEPMLRNNCYLSKEERQKWSWTRNRDFVEDYWREGVGRGEGHNVMFTIGMRGIHDGQMKDGKTTADKKAILEDVFAAQCAMLPKGAPKLFVPYKEVLPIFNSGLKVPNGATIMWVNDNFGYVRRLGGPQCKEYGGGIYWHISYHGRPHGYIHLCTTPPAFMWYELVAKCWENGVRDVWMVNAGDVFQAEILLDAYGRFASDPEAWKTKANPQREAIDGWVREELFGHKEHKVQKTGECLCELCVLCGKIGSHLAEYYNLGFNRRPEHMCVQWTTNLPSSVKSSLLKRYHALLAEDIALEKELSDATTFNSKLSTPNSKIVNDYFRLVGFQARFLAYAGIIHLEERDKEYARSVLDPLYERWDKLDDGKWSGFWCDTIDERGGMRQPVPHNRWCSQMQWRWNEPSDPYAVEERNMARINYPATAYRADETEPEWLEPVANEPANNGAWACVEGLGTSGRALALLPVKPGVGKGAAIEFSLTGLTGLTGFEKQVGNPVNHVNPVQKKNLVLQFLPDFALWPGLKLGVEVSFDDGAAKYVAVPKSDSNIGEHDPVRNRAVQDNFIRVEVPVPEGARRARIAAVHPGVVVDRVGIRTKHNGGGE